MDPTRLLPRRQGHEHGAAPARRLAPPGPTLLTGPNREAGQCRDHGIVLLEAHGDKRQPTVDGECLRPCSRIGRVLTDAQGQVQSDGAIAQDLQKIPECQAVLAARDHIADFDRVACLDDRLVG